MTSKLNRENGEVVILTEHELNMIYPEARVAWMKDFVCDMLNNRGIDPGELGDEKVEEITESFINNVQDHFEDWLGSLENEAFEYTMDNDYSELADEEE